MQIAGPRVVAEPGPRREDVVEIRFREIDDGRPAPEEGLVIGLHRRHGGLLQHDLAQPDMVRIGGLPRLRPPRQAAPMPVVPGQQCSGHFRAMRGFHGAATIDSESMSKKPKQPEAAKPEPQKEPRPRRNYMVALSAEVPAIAKAALGSKGYAEAGLFTHWAEIAGASLAASSLPVRLSFPRGKRDEGTLTVRCGGAAALELQHLAPSVLERINGHFGYRAVARLKIEQGAVSSRKVAPV